MTSLKIREFSQTILNYITETDLPWEIKRLALLEITNKVEEETIKELQKDLVERKEAQQPAETEEE